MILMARCRLPNDTLNRRSKRTRTNRWHELSRRWPQHSIGTSIGRSPRSTLRCLSIRISLWPTTFLAAFAATRDSRWRQFERSSAPCVWILLLITNIFERRVHREEMANAVAIQRTMLPPAAALLNCGDAFDLLSVHRHAPHSRKDFRRAKLATPLGYWFGWLAQIRNCIMKGEGAMRTSWGLD